MISRRARGTTPVTSSIVCNVVSSRADDRRTYRVVYTARLSDADYVLHAFEKKTSATAQRDIDLARSRFAELTKRQK
ncbi:type II toxin-antitoxin system RelE/ParE family toxin [Bradyrhizobium genosp. P]|uniref:type II toxin-antitoxin system RelE/ParE family toxin n=1 Tax=Bradyrhizobium genosp. P TaxID=83641 RepID=UPI003CEF00C8